jgi:hypothetical protein
VAVFFFPFQLCSVFDVSERARLLRSGAASRLSTYSLENAKTLSESTNKRGLGNEVNKHLQLDDPKDESCKRGHAECDIKSHRTKTFQALQVERLMWQQTTLMARCLLNPRLARKKTWGKKNEQTLSYDVRQTPCMNGKIGTVGEKI